MLKSSILSSSTSRLSSEKEILDVLAEHISIISNSNADTEKLHDSHGSKEKVEGVLTSRQTYLSQKTFETHESEEAPQETVRRQKKKTKP